MNFDLEPIYFENQALKALVEQDTILGFFGPSPFLHHMTAKAIYFWLHNNRVGVLIPEYHENGVLFGLSRVFKTFIRDKDSEFKVFRYR